MTMKLYLFLLLSMCFVRTSAQGVKSDYEVKRDSLYYLHDDQFQSGVVLMGTGAAMGTVGLLLNGKYKDWPPAKIITSAFGSVLFLAGAVTLIDSHRYIRRVHMLPGGVSILLGPIPKHTHRGKP